MHFVIQTQPNSDTVEVLWQTASYEQAEAEADRINSRLAEYGIPSSESYAYVM